MDGDIWCTMRFLFSISLAFLVFACENWFGILWQSYSCVFSREALNVTALCRITIWLIGRFHSSRTIKPASPRSPTWSATMYKKTFSKLRIFSLSHHAWYFHFISPDKHTFILFPDNLIKYISLNPLLPTTLDNSLIWWACLVWS